MLLVELTTLARRAGERRAGYRMTGDGDHARAWARVEALAHDLTEALTQAHKMENDHARP